jgi:UDP-GlcNAc:undecaprenyl-phosphate/decaprenyl-phosphate GlcNAc-1-phosphate transferase
MIWLLAFFIAFVASLLATRLVIALGISDIPNEARKLHTRITPTSGGLGIVSGVVAGLIYINVTQSASFSLGLISCLALALVGGALGFGDDLKAMGSKSKLAIMLVGTSLFASFGARIEAFEITPTLIVHLGPILGGLGTVLWLLVIVNTVNFMDGANGMAMGCACLGFLGLTGLILYNNFPDSDMQGFALLAWIASSACLGFLFWNVWRGQIFAGDSGALFVGLLSGGIGVVAVDAGTNPFSVALCFLPMLVDVILTVVMRLRRRQNLLIAHSDHAYQAAIKSGSGHLHTSGWYWVATVVAIALALTGQALGSLFPIGLFVAYTLVLSMLYFHTFKAVADRASGDDEQD